MIPKTLSATALQVAEACPARYKAEMLDRSRGLGTSAANTGSAVHGALEMFVKGVYLDKQYPAEWKVLLDFLKLSYFETFGSANYDTPEYFDAYEIVEKWFKRVPETFTDSMRVVSCEVKENFEVPTSAGPIPFNFIWDRFDEIKPGVFKVVDYKTNRWNITSEDLKKKIQARCYALACAIKLKTDGVQYERIWVEFDMLRYKPVGIVFTHEDNVATWTFIKNTVESIIARGEDEFEERLNPDCLFCVRKASCEALAKNIAVGGIMSLPDIESKMDLRAQIEFQLKGLKSLQTELDTQILHEAKERDLEEYESDLNKLVVTRSKRRHADPEMVEKAIGPKLFEKYGNVGITIESIEKLLKGSELTPEQKSNLRSLLYDKYGAPSVKIIPKNPIDED